MRPNPVKGMTISPRSAGQKRQRQGLEIEAVSNRAQSPREIGCIVSLETYGARAVWRPDPKGEKQMKDSMTDKIEGGIHEIKGKIKETVGQVTKNPDLEAEGQAENLDGKIQNKIGDVKKVFDK